MNNISYVLQNKIQFNSSIYLHGGLLLPRSSTGTLLHDLRPEAGYTFSPFGDAIPPPPGFPPLSWPIDSECVAVKRFGSSFGDGALPDVFVSNPDVEPPSSPIAQDQVSASADSPDDVLLISPLVDVGTDSVPDVIRPVALTPPIEQIFVPNRLWAPVAVPSPAIDDRCETPVPRWWHGPGGPVPGGAISRVDPFIGGWLCLQKYVVPLFGL